MLEKNVWKDLGGFDERLTLNEDYPFAKKIVAAGYHISFSKKAVVGWVPRKNLAEFATMIQRFAQGDAQAGILRPKVAFLFFRYLILLVLEAIILYYTDWKNAVAFLLVLFVLYSLWAIGKNKKYVKKGWYWLPVLQYTADVMVMIGTMTGAINNFK
jgi:cellulose synthase/poly-beta-1,6-N-acetylglucosamine synthase-like glycosyltransferase